MSIHNVTQNNTQHSTGKVNSTHNMRLLGKHQGGFQHNRSTTD